MPSPALPYCKRRETGRGLGNKATFVRVLIYVCAYVCVVVYIMYVHCMCMFVCVTMSCPILFSFSESGVVSCRFTYYRISWFDLVMFSELVISLLPNEDKIYNHLLPLQ